MALFRHHFLSCLKKWFNQISLRRLLREKQTSQPADGVSWAINKIIATMRTVIKSLAKSKLWWTTSRSANCFCIAKFLPGHFFPLRLNYRIFFPQLSFLSFPKNREKPTQLIIWDCDENFRTGTSREFLLSGAVNRFWVVRFLMELLFFLLFLDSF